MRVVIVSSLLLSVGTAQALDLSSLARPGVTWKTAKAKTADVTCDGKADTVVFGTGKKSIWVGIVPGDGGKPQAMRFGLDSGSQDGFCAVPKSIEVYPINCAAAADGLGIAHLPGCKAVKGCRAFAVGEECDPFNFYWDSRRKRMEWWRN